MPRKFLLVDDDPDDTDLFEEALKNVDHDVEFYSAQDCSDILSQLKGQKIQPEIIFLDINMPDMNGWECLAALKSDPELRDIPVLMYSTSSATLDGHKAIRKGALGFLEKPPSYEQLKAFLLQLVPVSSSNLDQQLKQIAATKSHRLVVA
jgi:CheY-like chemotaxis protein